MIQILTTGGTIGGLDFENELKVPKTISDTIERMLENAQVTFGYKLKSVFAKDSRCITAGDLNLLKLEINNTNVKRIVITHGTISMVETAQYLGRFFLNKTIVLLGSYELGQSPQSDAPFNLGFALGVIKFLEPGVYIAMQGQIFPWDKVVKNVDKNRFEYTTP